MNKNPKEIITRFVVRWVRIFGAPGRLVSDKGFEFQNEEMRMVANRFQIELLGTATESLEQWSL